MRAILVREFGGPDVLKLGQVDAPRIGPDEVCVEVHAVGVNPYETYMRTGTYAIKPALPYIPGSDAAGKVVSVGATVTRVKPGDRVYVYGTRDGLLGTYAEQTVCPATRVFPLDPRLTFAQGAGLGVPYTAAYRALIHRGNAKSGETVLIHGATGAVGLAAVQLARHRGMRVIGTGGSKATLDVVRAQGADVAVSHDAPGYRDEIMAATSGRGVDLVLEMAAHLNLDHDLTMLTHGGRIVVIGSRGRVEIDPRHAMNREAAIMGMVVFNAPEADVLSIHADLGTELAKGALNPIVREELPLGDAARAHEMLASLSPDAVGKIVLIP
jgi:NADPH2:quinone reductase